MADDAAGRFDHWFEDHKKAVLGVAGAGAAGLGYLEYRRKKNGTAASSALTPAQPATSAVAPGAATVVGYSGAPWTDTTGTDVYNALQPSLAQNSGLLTQLIADLQTSPPASSKKPPAKAKPKPHPITKHKPSPVKKLPPVHKAPTGKHDATLYTVRRGDNLTGIGARYGLSWQQVYDPNKTLINHLNGGRGANLIYPGTKLRIPR